MKWLNVMASLALMAGPSLAQREPSSILGPETDPLIIKVRDQLKNSDDTANLVSERISRSKLITLLTPAVDHEGRKAAAKEWIEHDPTAAARVAVGLMRDDQTGTTLYEDSFIHQTTLVFEHNPGSEKNLFNRLNKLAQSSKLIKKQSEELSEDEKNAILKTLYEGGERSHTQIHTSKEGNSDKTAGSAATSFNGIYDRLGAGNVRGYSAQLMSLQSSLNARRPPGIPQYTILQ
jgi:hypothetical protein